MKPKHQKMSRNKNFRRYLKNILLTIIIIKHEQYAQHQNKTKEKNAPNSLDRILSSQVD